MIIWLVVDLPLWKIMEFVSWDDDIPIYEVEKCSKPPTRLWLVYKETYNPSERFIAKLVRL